ncbi:hypothetical protein ACVWZV_009651 [Bradyrhizobium sp. GM5.1]
MEALRRSVGQEASPAKAGGLRLGRWLQAAQMLCTDETTVWAMGRGGILPKRTHVWRERHR